MTYLCKNAKKNQGHQCFRRNCPDFEKLANLIQLGSQGFIKYNIEGESNFVSVV